MSRACNGDLHVWLNGVSRDDAILDWTGNNAGRGVLRKTFRVKRLRWFMHNPRWAGPVPLSPSRDPSSTSNTDPSVATLLLEIVERSRHASRSEWLFFRELRVGTGGRRNGNAQRLDAFALNSLPHTGMKRVCYEVKASRSDFLSAHKPSVPHG